MTNQKYRLKRDMPGLCSGVIFEHRDWDPKYPDRGNRGYGVMILAWGEGGSCQPCGEHSWCGETFIMPGQLAYDRDWFEPVGDNMILLDKIRQIKDIINSIEKDQEKVL